MAIFPKERREYGLHGDYPRKLFDILELPKIWCTFAMYINLNANTIPNEKSNRQSSQRFIV